MPHDSIPSRKEYLRHQKHIHGRRLFGLFPAYFPREILWAMNGLPVEIWDPPLKVSHANTHLQPYICPVAKRGLELILQGQADEVEGFLFPHTCDSIQNLASIIRDYLGPDKPCYFFYNPKAPYRDSSHHYYVEELKGLVSRLEKQLGPLDLSELNRRTEQGERVGAVLRELYDVRARSELDVSNVEFYRVIRLGEYLHPDDFLPRLETFLKESQGRVSEGVGVVLSGVLPDPPEILSLLDNLGVRVVEDDLLNCGRRLIITGNEGEDPFEVLARRYFALPPCSTRASPLTERVDHLLKKMERTGARGAIFNMIKFCEPEFFDLPPLIGALKSKGCATLVVESELTPGLSAQLTTRVEAFVEMMG
jgi:benzoyl-CoA reductase/2-hydroxyglutaryl-CoA dehydratase subunit BcrC/BadD/HgdB